MKDYYKILEVDRDCETEEIKKWKEDYNKWLENNQHLPDNRKKTADELLAMPRPKYSPPTQPSPQATDSQLDEWGKKYEKWRKDNTHLPNLQPSSVILQRFKQQTQQPPVQNTQGLEQRITIMEQKLDKLMSHLGVK